jgi:hypothetical protein
MLKCTLKKQDVGMWNGLIWLRIGPMTGCCVHGKETSGYVKDEGVTDQLSDC